MRRWTATALTLLLLLPALRVCAQTRLSGGIFGDETELYAETKQVGQFFRRFNGEEGKDGERFYDGDELYRDETYRREYLNLLFDNEAGDIHEGTKRRFINDVCSSSPHLLDFHGGQWFAEVRSQFFYRGKQEEITLFMVLEADGLGYKWVIDRVRFDVYDEMFPRGEAIGDAIPFLHPLSHELDFMNLAKVFRDTRDIEPYTSGEFEPDHLTLFLLDIWRGNLEYVTVSGTRFHFFQVDGWYFSLRDIQRQGYNTGWLITRLEALDDGDQEALLHLIYND